MSKEWVKMKKKYELIADEVRKRILSGVYPAKSLMPDQQAFAQEFGVSKITIKKALDGIEHEGLIYKSSGMGTFVLGKIPLDGDHDASAKAFDGLSKQQGVERVTSDIIKFELEFPTSDLCDKLKIEDSDPIYNIMRLRRLNGEPFILEHTYMPVKVVPKLTEQILKSSIYAYIHQELKLKFGGAYRKIHAAMADEYDIKYLKAEANTPILEAEQVLWLTNGEYVEYSTSRNLYNTRSYTMIDINDF
jgi:GntR family transcriptional regulator